MSDDSENAILKKELELLFKNLYDNKLIYDERVTLLCELVKLETKDDRFTVELKVIKPLRKESPGQDNMFNHIISKPTFSVGAVYKFGGYIYVKGKVIGGPYMGFEIFTDADLVDKVCKMDEGELKEKLYGMLWE